jgi:hypothetical protein
LVEAAGPVASTTFQSPASPYLAVGSSSPEPASPSTAAAGAAMEEIDRFDGVDVTGRLRPGIAQPPPIGYRH